MTQDNGNNQPDRTDIERVQRLVGPHYRLNWIIGRGGMSTVWLADDAETGEPVAIKVLKPEYTDHAEFRERFRNEATAASLIDSPHVVHTYAYREVLDAGMAFCFIIMEFVRGESLADVLIREKQLPEPLALDVLQQAALGLQAIHAAGMVHRDIKPGNLLITPDGTVKVADFGIAKAAEAVPITRTGMVVGTAQYVSPEQAQGHKVGPASDIYSLGVVGYEMLTGERPFRGDSTVSVAIAHINTAPPPLPESLSRATREMIATTMRKDPIARYVNGAELTVAVAHVRNGEMPPLPEALHNQVSPDGTVDPQATIDQTPGASTTMFPTSGTVATTQFVSPTPPADSIAQVANVRDASAPSVQGPATMGGTPANASMGGAATNQGARVMRQSAPHGQGGTPADTRRNAEKVTPGADRNQAKAKSWLWTLIALLALVVIAIGAWLAFGLNRNGDRDQTGQIVTSVVTSVVSDSPTTRHTQTYTPPTTHTSTQEPTSQQPSSGSTTSVAPETTTTEPENSNPGAPSNGNSGNSGNSGETTTNNGNSGNSGTTENSAANTGTGHSGTTTTAGESASTNTGNGA